MPEFVFMLTRDDATVPDAHAVLDDMAGLGLRHIGFKDVGLPFAELRSLAGRIRDLGAAVYLEVVSESLDDELRSVAAAADLGVDWLLGGTHAEQALGVLAGTPVRYCPFPGTVVGHPSRLTGTHAEIVESARQLAALPGVGGLDLLAYRHDRLPATLARAVVDAVDVPVIAAGSVDSADRIDALGAAGVWGFTIGSAILDETLRLPGQPHGRRDLIRAVLALAAG